MIYDFAESRAGRHARDYLGDWRGTLVCDDYAGYKALFEGGVTEAGCMAHARRKSTSCGPTNTASWPVKRSSFSQRSTTSSGWPPNSTRKADDDCGN